MNKLIITLLLISLNSFAFDYHHPFSSEQKAIEYLLDEVEKSQGTFIRNGSEHRAKEAKEHLAHKLKMAKNMFWFFGPENDISLEEFVEKIASASSNSGKPYHIRLKNGRTVKTGDWLRERITDLQKKTNQKTH